jgi:hypothetical protein
MNNGASILLLDAEGNVSGGDRSADPRGGIFGAQGYGGGVFDGSTGLGSVGDTVNCAALCSTLILMPGTGPTLAAVCLDKCTKGEAPPTGCTVPAECASAVARFPQELPPELIAQYCGFPLEVQASIATACKSLAALPPGTVLPPPRNRLPPAKEEEVPPFMPGVEDPKTAQPPPPAEAGMGLGTVALIAAGALALGWALWGKKR